jgi:hypothetical protein
MSAHTHRLTALLAASGVHLIDLTMGEDPDIVGGTQSQIQEWVEMIRSVGQHTHLPVIAMPGCGFPVVVKPDQESGSRGVGLYRDETALHETGRSCWVATLIFCADKRKDLAAARNTCYKQIRKNLSRSEKNAGNQPKAMQDQDLPATKNFGQGNHNHDPAAAR